MTQADIKSTICKRGWTATVRPPVSYTEPLKLQQMKEYGETGSPSGYEEDHLIPLELGGNPTSPLNLWPQPHAGTYNSFTKDKVENAGKAAVCSGKIMLVPAQKAMAANWVSFGRSLGVIKPGA